MLKEDAAEYIIRDLAVVSSSMNVHFSTSPCYTRVSSKNARHLDTSTPPGSRTAIPSKSSSKMSADFVGVAHKPATMSESASVSVERPPFMFGKWSPGSGMDAVPEPADEAAAATNPPAQSATCGGTAHLLPRERRGASFKTINLTHFIDGGKKKTFRRRWLWSEGEKYDNSGNYYLPREDMVARHAKVSVTTTQYMLVVRDGPND